MTTTGAVHAVQQVIYHEDDDSYVVIDYRPTPSRPGSWGAYGALRAQMRAYHDVLGSAFRDDTGWQTAVSVTWRQLRNAGWSLAKEPQMAQDL